MGKGNTSSSTGAVRDADVVETNPTPELADIGDQEISNTPLGPEDIKHIDEGIGELAGAMLIKTCEHVEKTPMSDEDKDEIMDCSKQDDIVQATKMVTDNVSRHNLNRFREIVCRKWNGAIQKISKVDFAVIIAGLAAGGGAGFYCGGLYGAIIGAIIGGVAAPLALAAIRLFIKNCKKMGERIHDILFAGPSKA